MNSILFIGECVPLDLRCDSTSDCPDNSDESMCFHIENVQTPHNVPDNTTVVMSLCSHDSTELYQTHQRCIFETQEGVSCVKGEHLMHCESYQCLTMHKVNLNLIGGRFIQENISKTKLNK